MSIAFTGSKPNATAFLRSRFIPPLWISSSESKLLVHKWRSEEKGIMVIAPLGTVVSDKGNADQVTVSFWYVPRQSVANVIRSPKATQEIAGAVFVDAFRAESDGSFSRSLVTLKFRLDYILLISTTVKEDAISLIIDPYNEHMVVTDISGVEGVVLWVNDFLELAGRKRLRQIDVVKVAKWVVEEYDCGRTTEITVKELVDQIRTHLPDHYREAVERGQITPDQTDD